MIDNKRRHPRLKHRAKIRMVVPASSEAVVVDMRDFSETGLFLLCANELIPPIGALVEVQTTEFDDAPIQSAVVVRVEPGVGFGLEFTPS
ncbi:MAG: pilus assembly protein PilZ [Proteobacteria bacterium ST_bin11]|nr:MAG: pilus assembly protein PilZ [Proteobacteria bacterium ST_bin11]